MGVTFVVWGEGGGRHKEEEPVSDKPNLSCICHFYLGGKGG